eukprot:2733851-Prymnesium_polylepis.1
MAAGGVRPDAEPQAEMCVFLRVCIQMQDTLLRVCIGMCSPVFLRVCIDLQQCLRRYIILCYTETRKGGARGARISVRHCHSRLLTMSNDRGQQLLCLAHVSGIAQAALQGPVGRWVRTVIVLLPDIFRGAA